MNSNQQQQATYSANGYHPSTQKDSYYPSDSNSFQLRHNPSPPLAVSASGGASRKRTSPPIASASNPASSSSVSPSINHPTLSDHKGAALNTEEEGSAEPAGQAKKRKRNRSVTKRERNWKQLGQIRGKPDLFFAYANPFSSHQGGSILYKL